MTSVDVKHQLKLAEKLVFLGETGKMAQHRRLSVDSITFAMTTDDEGCVVARGLNRRHRFTLPAGVGLFDAAKTLQAHLGRLAAADMADRLAAGKLARKAIDKAGETQEPTNINHVLGSASYMLSSAPKIQPGAAVPSGQSCKGFGQLDIAVS
jgi:hypothetical protein